jgi:hypothetical protein
MTSDTASFRDMDGYLRIPRVNDLALSPTGDRLIATVAQLDDDGHTFVSSLWEIDPTAHLVRQGRVGCGVRPRRVAAVHLPARR